jgi:KaiC/GvpD/RAD55 family RecA-like ATPase
MNNKNFEIWYMKREATLEEVVNVVDEFKNKLSNGYQIRIVQSKSGGKQWSDTPSNSHYIYVYKKTDKLNSKYPTEPLKVIRVSDHFDNGNSGNYYDEEILVNRKNEKSVDDIINSLVI